MIRLTLLALTLLSSGAHANSESNVRPAIIRCDYPDNSNPRCVGVGAAESAPTAAPTATERHHKKSSR
jgi:hypothetical protein